MLRIFSTIPYIKNIENLRLGFVPNINAINRPGNRVTCSEWAIWWFNLFPNCVKNMPICGIAILMQVNGEPRNIVLGFGPAPFAVINKNWWCFNPLTFLFSVLLCKLSLLFESPNSLLASLKCMAAFAFNFRTISNRLYRSNFRSKCFSYLHYLKYETLAIFPLSMFMNIIPKPLKIFLEFIIILKIAKIILLPMIPNSEKSDDKFFLREEDIKFFGTKPKIMGPILSITYV